VPARETCEQCHWPQKFGGVRLRVFSKFADDEKNTRSETVLLMMVGGNKMAGIHGAHLGPDVRIRFTAVDAARQTIPWVEYRNGDTGQVQTFASPDPPAGSSKALPTYEMQCVDCHNRPAHTFESPERAMDGALASGNIAVTLPFIKKKGLELLRANYSTSEQAADKLPRDLDSFLRAELLPTLFAASSGYYTSGQVDSCDLQPQCLSRSEGHVGHLSK
jgi:hypothetical protein